MSDLGIRIRSNPTLTRGLAALRDHNVPLQAVLSDPEKVLTLPGISKKTLAALQEYALECGHVHPLVELVQRLLSDEWEAGNNNMPGWHHEPNQLHQLTKLLKGYL